MTTFSRKLYVLCRKLTFSKTETTYELGYDAAKKKTFGNSQSDTKPTQHAANYFVQNIFVTTIT